MALVNRKVLEMIHPQPVLEGAGVKLKRSFPTHSLDFPDPFLLLDHFGSDDPQDYMAGFPMHPHRGIETVTYMLSGAVHHQDSLGNSGTIEGGDVQWMTAGGGILHEEMPEERQGKMEGFQLWVNLPAKLKMTRPYYQEISAAHIPTAHLPGGAAVKVIAGKAGDITGPVVGIAADPVYLDVCLPAGKELILPAPADHTVLVYLYQGQAAFGDCCAESHSLLAENTPAFPPAYKIPETDEISSPWVSGPRLLLFDAGDQLSVCAGAEQEARFLVMMGKPVGEPIVRYGPFVMNTRAEILQALQDLRSGTFVRS